MLSVWERDEVDLYLRGVRERLRVSGLLDAERDFDFCRGDGLRFTLAWRDGTDLTGVPVFDHTGDFTWDFAGNGIDMMSWSESDPLLSRDFRFNGDLSGVWLRFSSAELSRALAEASESADAERRFCFLSSSSPDDVEGLRLLLLAAFFCGDADDADELRDELLEADFFLFSSGDFSDAEELLLLAGEADRLAGEADCLAGEEGNSSSSRGLSCTEGLGMWSATSSLKLSSTSKDLGVDFFSTVSFSASAVDLWGSGDDRGDLRPSLDDDDDEECLERAASPSYDESRDMLESCRLRRSLLSTFFADGGDGVSSPLSRWRSRSTLWSASTSAAASTFSPPSEPCNITAHGCVCRAFYHAGPTVWNSLPDELRNSDSDDGSNDTF